MFKLFSTQLQLLFAVTLLWSNAAQADKTITVFAASSMTNAINQIIALYQDQTGQRVRASYASSSTLARQISNGAPADIYISANNRWMDYLEQNGFLVDSSRQFLLSNSLVLVGQTDQQLDRLSEIPPLLSDDRLAIADPDHVPAGIYAKEALTQLNLWPSVKDKLARSHNVRGALLLVERGETPLGIVYRTDALMSKKVAILHSLPPESHQAIQYPMARINHQDQTVDPSILSFYNFLSSAAAAKIFTQYGFLSTAQEH